MRKPRKRGARPDSMPPTERLAVGGGARFLPRGCVYVDSGRVFTLGVAASKRIGESTLRTISGDRT